MRFVDRLPALALLTFAAGAASAEELPSFTFDPAAPRPGDTVSIHVETVTVCPLLSSAADRQGSVITFHYVEGCVCLPIGTPFPLELTAEVGPMPAGRHVVQLVRSSREHDGTLCVPPAVVGEDELVVSSEELALHDGRFLARATWRAFDGSTGVGRAVAVSEQSGYFWFFDPTNVEINLKVLDACPVNDHFWVFVAAASNVEYEIEVFDTADDSILTWTETNALGDFPSLRADTAAFPTCP